MGNPEMSLQEAVDHATQTKNSMISSITRFRTHQLVFGRNPTIPGIMEASTGSRETMPPNEIGRTILH